MAWDPRVQGWGPGAKLRPFPHSTIKPPRVFSGFILTFMGIVVALISCWYGFLIYMGISAFGVVQEKGVDGVARDVGGIVREFQNGMEGK